MTNRQRVIDAVRFKKAGPTPYSVMYTSQCLKNVLDYTGDPDFLNSYNDHLTFVGLDKPQTPVKRGYDMDEYHVVWNKSGADKDIGVIDRIQIRDLEDLERYSFPGVDKSFIDQQMHCLSASGENNFRIAGIGFSMFERAWTLMGMENLLCAMLEEPELVHRLMNQICERNLAVMDAALHYEFDCFYFGDDWGQQQGLIMGAPLWREFIKPYIARMYQKATESGRMIAQHSCGDIREIMDELHEIGLNIYQTFQPEIYGLEYAKKLKNKIAIWGGISTQADLPFKTPQEIRQIVRRTIDAFPDGGLIAAPTHGMSFDIPPQNIIAMIEEFKVG